MTKISAIAISLVLIILSVKFTLNFKPLYYYDINYLNISNYTDLNKNEIKSTYDYLIYFVNSSEKIEFKIPLLTSSKESSIHFQEVRNIFIKLDYILYFSLIIIVLGLYNAAKTKNFLLFKWSSNLIIIFSLCLLIPFCINFNGSFNLFHQIFFSNDYWIFDPALDPVINILPEEFFLHSALLIISLILLSSIFLKFLYHKLRR